LHFHKSLISIRYTKRLVQRTARKIPVGKKGQKGASIGLCIEVGLGDGIDSRVCGKVDMEVRDKTKARYHRMNGGFAKRPQNILLHIGRNTAVREARRL